MRSRLSSGISISLALAFIAASLAACGRRPSAAVLPVPGPAAATTPFAPAASSPFYHTSSGSPAPSAPAIPRTQEDAGAPTAAAAARLSLEDPLPSSVLLARPAPPTVAIAPPPDAASLLAALNAEPDEDARRSLVLAASEGLPVHDRSLLLARWFTREPSPGLQEEIIDALASMDGELPLRLALFTTALATDRAPAVRQAAANAVEGLDTPAARGLWLRLLPEAGFHDQAQAALLRLKDQATP